MLPQRPFQPGAWPPRPGLPHYMVYNSVGFVRYWVDQEMQEWAFVRFHLASLGCSHIMNPWGHTKAALSEHAVVLFGGASPGFVCRPLPCQTDTSHDWTNGTPSVQGVVASGDWVAVVSKPRILQVFVARDGRVLRSWSVPGPPVALVADVRGHQLVLFFHAAASGSCGRQAVFAQWFPVVDWSPSKPLIPVPLDPGVTIKWAGFSEDGDSLCYADSAGAVWLLTSGHAWAPICHVEPENFIVSVCESFKPRVLALPPVVPGKDLPRVCIVVPLQAGFLPAHQPWDVEQGELLVARQQLRAAERSRCSGVCLRRHALQTALDNTHRILLKRFSMAVKYGKRQLVAELASHMDSAETLQEAAKEARQLGELALAGTIERLQPGQPPADCGCPVEKVLRPFDVKEWFRKRAAMKAAAQRATPAASRAGVELGVAQASGTTATLVPAASSADHLGPGAVQAERAPSSSSGQQKKVPNNPFKVHRQPRTSQGGRGAPQRKRPAAKQRTLLDMWRMK